MTKAISNTDSVIDSRDVISRTEELVEECGEGGEVEELASLRRLVEQGEMVDDWENGAQLIHASYFKRHAQELAYDIGAVQKDAKWPNRHIDWDAAAEELKEDYTAVKWDGETYYAR